MGSVHVPDMYKAKHPKEFAEKFPQKKKEPDNLSPSERLRLDAMKAPKEETPAERKKGKRAEARIRAKARKEEEKEEKEEEEEEKAE